MVKGDAMAGKIFIDDLGNGTSFIDEQRGDAMRETPTGWQPIETAPRDGTRILLWDARKEIATSGYWQHDIGGHIPDSCEPPWSFWTPDNHGLDDWFDDVRGPSHWMPLHPPQKGGRDE